MAIITAGAVAATLLLTPLPGLGQATNEQAKGRPFAVLDRKGEVVGIIEVPRDGRPAFSPDWTRVAVIIGGSLTVVDIATGTVTPIASGVIRSTSVAWSPDGTQLAYAALRGSYFGIHRKAATGDGDEELLYQHPGVPLITDWSSDGRYLGFYTEERPAVLWALALDDPREPVEILRQDSSLLGPFFSPDGRFVAYQSAESGRNEIWVSAFDFTGSQRAEVRKWQISDSGAGRGNAGMMAWRRDGKELYYLAADGGVMAVDVTATSEFKSGPPRFLFKAPARILAEAGTSSASLRILGSLSGDGERFLFVVPPPQTLMQIALYDRAGNVVNRVGEPGPYSKAALSPDGSKVAVLRQDPLTGNIAVWTLDVATGKGVPVTSDDSLQNFHWWSPDGTHVAYVSVRENGFDWSIYRKAWNGEGNEQLLFRNTPGAPIQSFDVSADRRFLIFDGGGFLSVAPLSWVDALTGEAVDFREEFRTGWPQFSPDSRFMAYSSEESGTWEYWVRPFDASSGTAPAEDKWQITQEGAASRGDLASLVWRSDGKEILYYSAHKAAIMVMDVTTNPTFRAQSPRALFPLPANPQSSQFTHDGQRFVFLLPVPPQTAPAR